MGMTLPACMFSQEELAGHSLMSHEETGDLLSSSPEICL